MKLKILAIAIIIIIFGSTIVVRADNDSAYQSKIWKNRLREPWSNYMLFVSDKELQKNNTYEKLKIFFNECITPEDFYDRIEKYVRDAYKKGVGDPDISSSQLHIEFIVNEIIDNNATLDCQHQSLLFAAGVKAMFSHYDEELGRYVLNDGCGDFKLEIWRSFDLTPPIFLTRSHVQVVIDKWNGTDIFKINNTLANKIEVDTWEDEYRVFNKRNDCLFWPFLPAKLNSILYTGSRFFP